MESPQRRLREIDSVSALKRQGKNWSHSVIQGLDLSGFDFKEVDCTNTVFLGCNFPEDVTPGQLYERGSIVFPKLSHLPYKPYRGQLYSREELMKGWTPEDDQSKDLEIYNYFSKHGRVDPTVMDALAMRLHDHAIDDALADLLEGRTENDGKKKVIGIMGGHSTPRTDPYYEKVALIAQQVAPVSPFQPGSMAMNRPTSSPNTSRNTSPTACVKTAFLPFLSTASYFPLGVQELPKKSSWTRRKTTTAPLKKSAQWSS